MTQLDVESKYSTKKRNLPMGSLYKELLTYSKGLASHRQNPGAGYDFVFANTLRAHEYRILGKKGEGTFSEVLKCQHIKDGTYYACKKMKQHYNGVEEVNNLREIQAMRRLNPHANVIELHEIIFDKKTGTVALICELMDMNIYELIRGRRHYLQESKVKNYMYQLLKSLDHMHRCGIFHRDVKPENILIRDDVLKLADFGSCRSVYSKQPYTEYISTRWYRAPECLLTDGYYTYRMDLWSVGCVFFEVMSLHPLFPGANEVDQIAKIHDVLGTPEPNILNKMKHRNRGINFDFPPKKGTGVEKLLPHASQQSIELIYKMCTYDPDERITAKQALRHSYFRDLRDADKRLHEAKQAARFNETTSSKTGPASNAGDVPIWKQNQIQKKRSSEGRLPLITGKEFMGNIGAIAPRNSKETLLKPSKHNITLHPMEELKPTNSKASALNVKTISIKGSNEYFPVTNGNGETGFKDFMQSPGGYKAVVNQNSNASLSWPYKRIPKLAKANLAKSAKPAVWKGNAGQQKKFMGEITVSKMIGSNGSSSLDMKANRKKVNFLLDEKESDVKVGRKSKKYKNLGSGVKELKRRQRRLIDQQGPTHGAGSGALPQIVPVNGTAIHGPTGFTTTSKPPFPSSTLPKVPLHHSHQQQGATLLPGILKPNLLSTKHLPKHKIKSDVGTKSMYGHGHYQLPSLNRHVYH